MNLYLFILNNFDIYIIINGYLFVTDKVIRIAVGSETPYAGLLCAGRGQGTLF